MAKFIQCDKYLFLFQTTRVSKLLVMLARVIRDKRNSVSKTKRCNFQIHLSFFKQKQKKVFLIAKEKYAVLSYQMTARPVKKLVSKKDANFIN